MSPMVTMTTVAQLYSAENVVKCLNGSDEDADVFNITADCSAFDFYVYTVFVGLLCCCGIVGNCVSFAVLWHDDGKTATAFLLRSLAVSDSLVLVMVIPLYVLAHVHEYTGLLREYFESYANILPVLWPCYLIPYTGTILLTVLVSLNRYMAVCRPSATTTRFCSLRHARIQVVAIAAFSVVYNIPRYFEFERKEFCVGYNASREAYELSAVGESTAYRIVYANILYFVLMHGGPLLSLAFLNCRLIQALQERRRRRALMGKAGGGGGLQTDVTLALIVVVFAFICCQTPTFVDHVMWTLADKTMRTCGKWHYFYTAIADALAVLNSSINFVIYVLTNRRFRVILTSTCVQDGERRDVQRLRIIHETTAITCYQNGTAV